MTTLTEPMARSEMVSDLRALCRLAAEPDAVCAELDELSDQALGALWRVFARAFIRAALANADIQRMGR